MKLPKKVYIRVNNDGAEPFLEVGEDTTGFAHGDKVGIFEPKEICDLYITKKNLVEKLLLFVLPAIEKEKECRLILERFPTKGAKR